MKTRTRSRRAAGPAAFSVSLPSKHRSWVEARIESGGYGTISDYIVELIRRDQKGVARKALEKKLVAALDSGRPVAADPSYWKRKHTALERRGARVRRAR